MQYHSGDCERCRFYWDLNPSTKIFGGRYWCWMHYDTQEDSNGCANYAEPMSVARAEEYDRETAEMAMAEPDDYYRHRERQLEWEADQATWRRGGSIE